MSLPPLWILVLLLAVVIGAGLWWFGKFFFFFSYCVNNVENSSLDLLYQLNPKNLCYHEDGVLLHLFI